MAFVRSRVQRSIGGSFSRVGLGAGDDRVHAVSRLGNRRGRPSPNFFPWRLCLPGCPRGHGLYDDKMAGACRRLVSLGIGEAIRTAGVDAGARPYSATRQRSISFSIIYMVMNVGYLI